MTGAWRFTTGADCTRVWRWYAHVGPVEIVRTVALACTRAAIVALPLATSGAAFAPATHAPPLQSSAFAPYAEGGALFAPSLLDMPLRDVPPVRLAAVPAGVIPAEAGVPTPVPSGGRPLTFAAPLDVPSWLPDRTQGDVVPVDEPAGWAVLLTIVGAFVAVRRIWRNA